MLTNAQPDSSPQDLFKTGEPGVMNVTTGDLLKDRLVATSNVGG